jgi:hypothetical protein
MARVPVLRPSPFRSETVMNRFDRINAEDKPATPKKRKVRPGWKPMTAKKLKESEPAPVEPPKSFEDKLRDNDYTSKLPWPHVVKHATRPNRVVLIRGDLARAQRQACNEDQARLEAEFKADMFAHYGVTGHPKAQRAYEIAWSHGHSAGFAEVDIYFSELAELLQP